MSGKPMTRRADVDIVPSPARVQEWLERTIRLAHIDEQVDPAS